MIKQRVLYFDVLNICACLSVIFLHCNGIVWSYSNTLAWKQALLVEVFCYWAVPVFFMLSGATLMRYREKYDTKEFFKKRFSRMVVPFFVWSVINVVLKRIDITGWNIATWINKILLTEIENVYWFFIPLFAVYMAMPVLSLLTNQKKVLWYMVSVAFATQCMLPMICSWLGITFNVGLMFPLTGGYVIYVILGYLLSIEEIQKKYRYILYVLGLGAGIFRYVNTYLSSTYFDSLDTTYFSYTQFHTVLLAVGVFVLFKYINWNKIASIFVNASLISRISSCSFGVYLIHMLIYKCLEVVLGFNTACWQWRIFAPFLIYLIGLIVVLILKKIPVIRRIVP